MGRVADLLSTEYLRHFYSIVDSGPFECSVGKLLIDQATEFIDGPVGDFPLFYS